MARVSMGYVDGKLARKSFYAKTRAEAVSQAQDFLHAFRQGGFAPVSKDCTVGEWLDKWLEVFITTPPLAPKTVKSYKEQVNNHIKPSLGRITLRKLTGQEVQKFMTAKLNEGLSSTSVNGIHRVLRASLSQAQRERLVADNVAKFTKPPRVETRSETFFTQPELRKLFAIAEGHHLRNLILLAPYTGMRIGELTGLRWSDVDFKANTITVRNQLQWVDGKPILLPPKSKSSKRVLPLDEDVMKLLADQKMMFSVNGFENKMDLVFVSSKGSPLDPKLANKHLKDLCEKAEIRQLSFHSFRHTAATLMLSAGEEASEVMNFLGHSQIALTVNTYGGVMREAQRRASSRLKKAINEGV